MRTLRRKIRDDAALTDAASALAEAFARADAEALASAIEAQDTAAMQALLGLSEAQLNRFIALFENRATSFSRFRTSRGSPAKQDEPVAARQALSRSRRLQDLLARRRPYDRIDSAGSGQGLRDRRRVARVLEHALPGA
jgi:hypothetical protein